MNPIETANNQFTQVIEHLVARGEMVQQAWEDDLHAFFGQFERPCIATFLHRIGIASRNDISRLNERVDRLIADVERLQIS